MTLNDWIDAGQERPEPVYEGKPFCNAASPSGNSTCYLDTGHTGVHHAPCAEHGDVNCGHEEEWTS